MESTINDRNKIRDRKYPYLGISEEDETITIVLFSSSTSGIVVFSTNQYNTLGEYCEDWVESDFDVYTGEVLLKN